MSGPGAAGGGHGDRERGSGGKTAADSDGTPEPDLPLVVGRSDSDEVKEVGASQVSLTQLMGPGDANLMGSVFGGVILAAVDKIAYVCATRHAGRPCVTASFDQVDFRAPIRVGEIVTLKASVNTVGRTSMEVGVRVSAQEVAGGGERHTNSCYVTMVALDEERRPAPVPRLRLETPTHLRRYRDAEERREARLELARRRKERRED